MPDSESTPTAHSDPTRPRFASFGAPPGPLSADDQSLLADRTVVVVMPAYNAARTLRLTWEAVPREWVHLIILVDDHSKDETLELASQLGITVVAHPHNVGYGGNQKTCYAEALRRGADVVVMLHPDGQYDPTLIPDLVRPILRNEADMVLGSRLLAPGGARAGGMPWWKYGANRSLTTLENAVLRQTLSEMHTGYRAYSRQFLETVPFLRNANGFVFDTQVIAQAVYLRQRIVEVPVSTIYFEDASSTSFRQSTVYGLGTVWTMLRYALAKHRLLPSRVFSR